MITMGDGKRLVCQTISVVLVIVFILGFAYIVTIFLDREFITPKSSTVECYFSSEYCWGCPVMFDYDEILKNVKYQYILNNYGGVVYCYDLSSHQKMTGDEYLNKFFDKKCFVYYISPDTGAKFYDCFPTR